MKEYQTVYSYTQNSSTPMWTFGLIFILLGLLITRANYKINDTFFNVKTLFGIAFSAFGTIWTISVFSEQSNSNSFAREALSKKNIKVVEGVVEDFEPMPIKGHKHERFRVRNVLFEYSDFEIIEGFNNTKSHGGPIKGNGDSVRIGYYTKDDVNYIVKLEMKNYP